MKAILLLLVLLGPALGKGLAAEPEVADRWIGYTEFQTNLPGGRHANVRTMRAMVVKADRTCHKAGDVINVEHSKGMPKTPKGIRHAQILR